MFHLPDGLQEGHYAYTDDRLTTGARPDDGVVVEAAGHIIYGLRGNRVAWVANVRCGSRRKALREIGEASVGGVQYVIVGDTYDGPLTP